MALHLSLRLKPGSRKQQLDTGSITVSILFCMYFSLLSLLQPALLCAEELSIAGVKFQVDELVKIDAENVQLSIGGETVIIPQAQLESLVIQRSLKDHRFVANLEDKVLENFAIERLRIGNTEQAAQALEILFERQIEQPLYAQKFLESLPADVQLDTRLQLYRSIILALRDSERLRVFITYPMYRIGLKDPDWLRVNATAAVYLLGNNLKELAAREFSRALAANDFSAMETILRFLQELFGANDTVYRKFRLAQSRILEVKQLLEQQKVELITPWIKGIKNDSELFALLADFVYETLRQQAAIYLQAKRPELALRILIWIDASRRSPQLHLLVLDALTGLGAEERQIVADSSIAEMLLLYANHDQAISEKYQEILAEQVRLYLDQDQPNQSEIYFSHLEQLKTRDFNLLDELRIEQALVYGQKGFSAIARRKLQQVSGGIGLINRIRLAMLGLYSHNVMRLVLMFSMLTFGSAWFFVRYKRIASEAIQSVDSEARQDHRKERADAQSQVTFSARSRSRDPRSEEYAVCLRVLGLQATSTLREIKTAYRSKVKDAHPDRQASGSGTASDRFIQLTSAYERALELRTELGIVDG